MVDRVVDVSRGSHLARVEEDHEAGGIRLDLEVQSVVAVDADWILDVTPTVLAISEHIHLKSKITKALCASEKMNSATCVMYCQVCNI